MLTLTLARRGRDRPSLLARYAESLGELTLRHQTDLAMAAAKVESDLANRAKSALLGTMSHELRTPLNAIIGFSDLIRGLDPKDLPSPKCADYASYIGEAGQHLLAVVSDVLDFSKLESGSFTLNLEPASIAAIVAETIPLVGKRIEEKRLRLDVRIEKGIPRLNVDARRIKQILINLLSNAIKFTPEHGRIILSARASKDGGATVAVVDSGVGMDDEQIAIALTPFGQVQSHLTRTQEGTGLGLPIALGLARQHGGDLYLDSEPGKGLAVVLTLPGDAREASGAPRRSLPGGGERAERRSVFPWVERRP